MFNVPDATCQQPSIHRQASIFCPFRLAKPEEASYVGENLS